MSLTFGAFNFGGAAYHVYESNRTVTTAANAALPGLNNAAFSNLFNNGWGGVHATTVWEDGTRRIDMQNGNNGPVNFPNHNVNAVAFDNLSLQVGGASLAVLYLETPFAGMPANVAGYRAPFVAHAGPGAANANLYFLRLLYTWLRMSNIRNRVYVICTSANFTVNAVANVALTAQVGNVKAQAQVALP